MYFGSRVQKVVYFPSDNSDPLSSHFSVQSEVHYFWTVSARILVYSQKSTLLLDRLSSHFSVQSKAIYFTGTSRISEAALRALSATHCLFCTTTGTAVLQPVLLSVLLLPATSLNNESTMFHWLRNVCVTFYIIVMTGDPLADDLLLQYLLSPLLQVECLHHDLFYL
eukprot:COSAG01_NODE_149_length_24037_cov_98.384619_5_plen_167_part_00